ncbi:hypothetical protein AB4124_23740 [Paenibacillus sp. 2KB_20]|uniref:hypothetical protein n=1 Tax=Paenibacillus sp. 2KB_20 TaxID=3232977 RepID=UPI003F954B71
MKDKALEWAIFAEKIVRLAGKKITKIQTQSLIEVTYKNAGELVLLQILLLTRLFVRQLLVLTRNMVFFPKKTPMDLGLKITLMVLFGLLIL